MISEEEVRTVCQVTDGPVMENVVEDGTNDNVVTIAPGEATPAGGTVFFDREGGYESNAPSVIGQSSELHRAWLGRMRAALARMVVGISRRPSASRKADAQRAVDIEMARNETGKIMR